MLTCLAKLGKFDESSKVLQVNGVPWGLVIKPCGDTATEIQSNIRIPRDKFQRGPISGCQGNHMTFTWVRRLIMWPSYPIRRGLAVGVLIGACRLCRLDQVTSQMDGMSRMYSTWHDRACFNFKCYVVRGNKLELIGNWSSNNKHSLTNTIRL